VNRNSSTAGAHQLGTLLRLGFHPSFAAATGAVAGLQITTAAPSFVAGCIAGHQNVVNYLCLWHLHQFHAAIAAEAYAGPPQSLASALHATAAGLRGTSPSADDHGSGLRQQRVQAQGKAPREHARHWAPR